MKQDLHFLLNKIESFYYIIFRKHLATEFSIKQYNLYFNIEILKEFFNFLNSFSRNSVQFYRPTY